MRSAGYGGRILSRHCSPPFRQQVRDAADCESAGKGKGLVLGAYEGCNPGEMKLTNTGMKFNEEGGGKLAELIKGVTLPKGKALMFSNISSEFDAVTVSCIGREGLGYDNIEVLDVCKESVRSAAGAGARLLADAGLSTIFVEGFTSTEAAAEGAALAVWKYQDHKAQEDRSSLVKVDLYEDPDREGWQQGIVKAEAQNLARRLEEAPANLMTPSIFAQRAIDILCPCGVQVDVRDRDWMELKKMTATLAMARGSCEAPLFLELGYCAGAIEDRPVAIVGKGMTYDTGGLCLLKCKDMPEMRGAMAGAAVVVAVFKAAASLNLPINLNGFIPLCENMPGGLAVKPGDVVVGKNGKTIRLEDTDHEGRVVLADALYHTLDFKPCLIMNLASISHTTKQALGSAPTAAFTESNIVWRELERAGSETGDRVWRMPLWKEYLDQVTNIIGVDVNNISRNEDGACCLSAAFLTEFVPPGIDFVHLDITGTGLLGTGVGTPYLRKGVMTGRPVRTVVQFLYQMACPHDKGDDCA